MSDILAAFLYARGLVGENDPHEQILARAGLVRECLVKLRSDLDHIKPGMTDEEIQSIFYEAGKIHFLKELRYWFKVLYQIFLGNDDGPRLGQFYGYVPDGWFQDRIDLLIHKDPWRSQV